MSVKKVTQVVVTTVTQTYNIGNTRAATGNGVRESNPLLIGSAYWPQ